MLLLDADKRETAFSTYGFRLFIANMRHNGLPGVAPAPWFHGGIGSLLPSSAPSPFCFRCWFSCMHNALACLLSVGGALCLHAATYRAAHPAAPNVRL